MTDQDTAREDLAFMRAIVEERGPVDGTSGLLLLTAGVLYGVQCLANWALLAMDAQVSTAVWMAVGWLPTIIFLIINFAYVWKDRANPFGTGTSKRAMNAAFSGAGIANAVLALAFGWVAWQRKDWSIWLMFPAVVCALQGAVWYVAAILRRRLWLGLVSAGWFATAAILTVLTRQVEPYLLVLGLALFLFMALPGYVMWKSSAPEKA